MSTYTSDDVLKATRLTSRQLDHWLRQGYVDLPSPTPGSGHPRRFTDAELDSIGTLAALVGAGLKPDRAAEIAQCPQFETEYVQIQFDPEKIHADLRKALTI